LGYAPHFIGAEVESQDENRAKAAAAVTMAQSLGASAIIVLTRSGSTAQAIASYRPSIPVIACTADPSVQRHLQMYFGVVPLLIEFSNDPEMTVRFAFEQAKKSSLLRKKDTVVLVSDIKVHKDIIGTVQARSLS
jgi:pyruvate kinase